MKNLRIVDILKTGQVGTEITVKGWVRTRRGSKNVNFIALNDGSTINNLQIVADVETFGEEIFRNINTGAAIGVTGILAASSGSGQSLELQAATLEVIGVSDPEKYPIQPKRHSLDSSKKLPNSDSKNPISFPSPCIFGWFVYLLLSPTSSIHHESALLPITDSLSPSLESRRSFQAISLACPAISAANICETFPDANAKGCLAE